MAEKSWNFNFLPPHEAAYSRVETCVSLRLTALVNSVAANKHCEAVKKVFNTCRSTPYGKVVEPAACQKDAEALVQCYHDVRMVPPACKASYEGVLGCLYSGSSCKTQMDGYLECAHPAAAKYQKYGQ